MNSNTLIHLLQNGFRITLGATATLVEVLQDPQKRDENFTKLRQDWGQLSETWAVKGELTEEEARNFVNNLLDQRSRQSNGSPYSSAVPTATPTADPNVQIELQELTNQIASIRAELEKLRNPE